ncbi:Transcription elongation factor B polypeptide 1 [Trichinella papuae]|uniref:Elongin-C n=1 Tax=Trichinella papuae TaxID=268474 RepID=A0A0V1M9V0_9BILA|nr:Transcription elongation factor B polypeptide 1 [Trichinella papuae]KRZ68443.1 Transcription elongation factor B polypeptide 1 [Trichinella papuae]
MRTISINTAAAAIESTDKVENVDDFHGNEQLLQNNNAGRGPCYVKLISSDCHEFIVPLDMALAASGTIKAMLAGMMHSSESDTFTIRFREIPSSILQKVVHYFQYRTFYSNSSTEIPHFPIPRHLALQMLMAATFLDC